MTVITKEQRKALFHIWKRKGWATKPATYRQFRRTAFRAFGDCVMVPFAGMILGIESDGHIHS